MLKLNIIEFYILLGDKCNFSCRYCIQGCNSIKGVKLPETIDPYMIKFLKTTIKKQENPPNLLFYGGEPLIYFSNLRKIIESTKDLGVTYSLITNASLLTEEIISFFNQYKVTLIVSWDGNRSENTRKVNVFNNQELKTLIFKANYFAINSVISAMNYPLEACQDIQELANEYKSINPNGVFSVNFDEIIDNKLHDRSLLAMDYERVELDVIQIIKDCKQYLDKDFRQLEYNDFNFVKCCFLRRYLFLINNYKNNPEVSKYFSPCKDGIERIGIDLMGNIYSCHDSREILGNVHNLDLLNYFVNYFKNDKTKELYENLCKDCKYYPMCQSRCKLLTIEARVNHTCKLKKAIGEPLLSYLDSKGS